MQRLWRKGDPPEHKLIGNDGLEWCNHVMKWHVNKVFPYTLCSNPQNETVADGYTVQDYFYDDDYTESDWNRPSVLLTKRLYACEDDKAPVYGHAGNSFVFLR